MEVLQTDRKELAYYDKADKILNVTDV